MRVVFDGFPAQHGQLSSACSFTTLRGFLSSRRPADEDPQQRLPPQIHGRAFQSANPDSFDSRSGAEAAAPGPSESSFDGTTNRRPKLSRLPNETGFDTEESL